MHDGVRGGVQEMQQEYDRLKAQEDSLKEANQEVKRLQEELKDARASATEAQKRHQEEQQAVLDRMSTVSNGKVCTSGHRGRHRCSSSGIQSQKCFKGL